MVQTQEVDRSESGRQLGPRPSLAGLFCPCLTYFMVSSSVLPHTPDMLVSLTKPTMAEASEACASTNLPPAIWCLSGTCHGNGRQLNTNQIQANMVSEQDSKFELLDFT